MVTFFFNILLKEQKRKLFFKLTKAVSDTKLDDEWVSSEYLKNIKHNLNIVKKD